MAELVRYDCLYVGGEWVRPLSGRYIESINPATGKVWAVAPEGDRADIDRAVAAAREAFERGSWRTMTPTERGHLIRRLADLLKAHVDRIAEVDTRDNGKPIRDSRAEVSNSVEWLYYFAGLADKIQGDYLPLTGKDWAYTIREPLGVVGAIIPWNSPTLLAIWKLGPALAAGNTVVLKPAEQTPCGALELARLIHEAGFPPGVVNVVPGYGPTAGAALVEHPDVDKIAFTGEHRTAQIITQASAVNLKRLSFECGGKSPHIVFPDADLQQALIAAVSGMFVNAGQQCSVGSRLFLHEDIYEDFLARFLDKVRRLRVGNPLDPRTHMGAISSQEQLAKIERYVDIARAEGARILLGGTRWQPDDPELQGGYWYSPTVVTEVHNKMQVCQDEIFGPVVAVLKFRTEEEVLEMANDVPYGLVAGVWTNDIRRAHRMAQRLKAGLIWLNTYRRHHWTLPYGGYKISGYGRENGLEVIHEYTQVKSVVVDLNESRPDPYED